MVCVHSPNVCFTHSASNPALFVVPGSKCDSFVVRHASKRSHCQKRRAPYAPYPRFGEWRTRSFCCYCSAPCRTPRHGARCTGLPREGLLRFSCPPSPRNADRISIFPSHVQSSLHPDRRHRTGCRGAASSRRTCPSCLRGGGCTSKCRRTQCGLACCCWAAVSGVPFLLLWTPTSQVYLPTVPRPRVPFDIV